MCAHGSHPGTGKKTVSEITPPLMHCERKNLCIDAGINSCHYKKTYWYFSLLLAIQRVAYPYLEATVFFILPLFCKVDSGYRKQLGKNQNRQTTTTKLYVALTSVDQLCWPHPTKRKVAGSNPVQGACLGGAQEAIDQCISRTLMFFYLPSPLSKNNKMKPLKRYVLQYWQRLKWLCN